MKTNKLMTAVALSAMFAACTQDAELNETLAKNDYSNIPMVEADFTVNTGVDSRMATGWDWELQDKVGFAWLGTGVSPLTIDGTAYQNNPLYCVDADAKAFKSEGMFYIGKYFAYMPYTEGNHTAEPIEFQVTGQPLTTNRADLAKHAIFISPKLTTLEKPVDGETSEGTHASGIGNNLPLEIARVSNAATINLTFANAEGLTDLKVYGLSLNAKVGGGSVEVLPESFTYAPTADAAVTNKVWKGYNKATFYGSTAEAGSIEATSKDGIAVSNNALTIYMLTMPKASQSHAIDAFEVKVNTNYGVVTVDMADTYGADNDLCITFAKENNKDVTVATTALFNDFGSNGTMNVYVDMDTKVIDDLKAATQDELNEHLNMLATAGYENPITITLNPTNANKANNFVLTDFTLPEGLKTIVTLATGTKATNGISFEGTTIINKQIVVASPSTVKGTMTVNYIKDLVTLNAAEITVDNGATLINNGQILAPIVTKAATTGNNAKPFGKYISNNDNAAIVGAGSLTNNGEVQWIDGTLPTITGEGPVYAEATDLAGIEAANEVVSVIRLIDGAWIGNNTEAILYDNITTIECYGNVDFYVTDTPRGAANTFGFPYAIIYVMKDATLTINSDNKNNILETGDLIAVKENAVLSITNIICDAEVNNWGEVWLNNAKKVDKGYEHPGSSWNSTENN